MSETKNVSSIIIMDNGRFMPSNLNMPEVYSMWIRYMIECTEVRHCTPDGFSMEIDAIKRIFKGQRVGIRIYPMETDKGGRNYMEIRVRKGRKIVDKRCLF